MQIAFLGGGTGGHLYPLLAVVRALHDIKDEEHLVDLKVRIVGDTPPPSDTLQDEDMTFEYIPAGKIRRYASLRNIVDIPKTCWGIIRALTLFTSNPPDAAFAKGGYASFPALVACRILRIPVMIHETDSVPGVVNRWASRFATRIAISFPETAKLFPKEKTALTGNPIRKNVIGGNRETAMESFGLEEGTPVLVILGGSQGAERINDLILGALPELLKNIQIIHQCGEKNFQSVKNEAMIIIESLPKELRHRYHPYGFLREADYREAGKVADVVVSRSGGAIFEIAAWGVPLILIPISESAQNHQRENAFNYARTGAAEVLEETNVTTNILASRVLRIVQNPDIALSMRKSAQAFAKVDAATVIARELIALGTHT